MVEQLQRAVTLHQRGELAQAADLYRAVLARDPRNVDGLRLLGTIALQTGDARGAIALISQAIELHARDPVAFNNRAVAYRQLGRFADALRDADDALRLDAGYADAHLNRGVALKELGRLREALAAYDRALALAPGNADAHSNRSVVLLAMGRPQAALESADEALRLRAFAEAWFNRGNALHALGHAAPAVAAFTEAARLHPGYVDAFNNRGVVNFDAGEFDAAMTCFEHAMALDPRHADAAWNASLVVLLHGRLAEGLPLYERRRELAGSRNDHPDIPQPLWLGDAPLEGKTILLRAEQGLGDTIQFCRYAALVKQRGARVLLQVPAPLMALMRGLEGVDEVVELGRPLPRFDLHTPLMSLPLAFRTTLADIPAPTRYLHADPTRVAAWADALGPRTRPRVGLAWSGRKTHRRDAQRSIALAQLLQRLPGGYDYVSLQNELRDEDRKAAAGLRHFGDRITDFADTAALCELVDVVVTVDTSVAHLAGALGRPAWVMLAAVPDWRWLLAREDSPWYPTVRLFRQDAARDWSPVLQRVSAALAETISR